MPLAQAEKIILRTCCVPDAFCRMSDLTEIAKGEKMGWGCARMTRRGEELPYTIPGNYFCRILWSTEMTSSLLSGVQ